MPRHILGALAAVLISPTIGHAQTFNFESAAVTPGGQQISIVRLPVKMPDGSVLHKDVVMQFEFVGNRLRFAVGYPKVENSSVAEAGPFVAGSYDDGVRKWTLAGPLPGPSGRSRWSLRSEGRAAEFYTGATDGHPLSSRIEKAAIEAPYTFGIFSSGTLYSFGDDDLLALVQVDRRTLQVLDFTRTKDRAVPFDVLTMTRK